jgi:hypothetical protein
VARSALLVLNAQSGSVQPFDLARAGRLVRDCQLEGGGNPEGGLHFQAGAAFGNVADGARNRGSAKEDLARLEHPVPDMGSAFLHDCTMKHLLQI